MNIDYRILQAVPEPGWSSDLLKPLLAAIEGHRTAHQAIVDEVNRDAEKLSLQDLASAKLPSPLKKLQTRLRIAVACLAYHESLLICLEALLPEAEARHQGALKDLLPIRAQIDKGLLELGFASQLDPRIYTRNRLLIEARNRATFADVQVGRIREARHHCQERINGLRAMIPLLEAEIRSAVS